MAVALVALVVGGLTAAAATGTAALVRTGSDATAVALAVEQLERLRAGPRGDGTDAPTGFGGATFARTWRVTPGRGLPDRLETVVEWGGHRVALATEAWP